MAVLQVQAAAAETAVRLMVQHCMVRAVQDLQGHTGGTYNKVALCGGAGGGGGGGSSRPTPPQETLDDPDVPLASSVFVDVDSSAWYAGSVSFVCTNKLMQGTSATTFAPNLLLDRGMMAQIMYNMAGKPTGAPAATFSDLTSGVYYADAVAWGVENELLLGYSNGMFGGGDALTREQMVVVLYRYARLVGYQTTARGSLARLYRQRQHLLLRRRAHVLGSGRGPALRHGRRHRKPPGPSHPRSGRRYPHPLLQSLCGRLPGDLKHANKRDTA